MVLFAHLLAGGLLSLCYCSWFEWFVHRNFMHRPRRPLRVAFERHQLVHHARHRSPDKYLFEPNRDDQTDWRPFEDSSMPLVFVCHLPLFLALAILLSPAFAVSSLTTTGLYLYLYELIHWTMHHDNPSSWLRRTAYFRFIDELHFVHHRRVWKNYNVVFPLADVLFGTLQRRPTDQPAKIKV